MADSPGQDLATGKNHIEIDETFDNSDADSACDSGISTGTTSITSSVFSFTYSNGRRYHSDRFSKASYYMPNDEQEQDRLDLYHHIFGLMLDGKLYEAPLKKPQCVLDLGTGTGIWAVDFADQHPAAVVVGNDVSPIQPSWVPNNVKFEVDDIEEEWTHPNNHFDYIHMRSLSGSIANWPKLMKSCFEATAPGGYVEYQDYACEVFHSDGSRVPDSDKHAIGRWIHNTVAAAERQGRPLPVARLVKKLMEDAGYVDVVEVKKLWPLSGWPKDPQLKEIGRFTQQGMVDTVTPWAMQLLTKGSEGWTTTEVKEMCDKVKSALTTERKKYFSYGYFVYGRKP